MVQEAASLKEFEQTEIRRLYPWYRRHAAPLGPEEASVAAVASLYHWHHEVKRHEAVAHPGHGPNERQYAVDTDYVDGLKRFRLEWEPTQSLRLIPMRIRGQINWVEQFPKTMANLLPRLFSARLMERGLKGLRHIPDTEFTRHMMLRALVDGAHRGGGRRHVRAIGPPLGDTPLQCMLTMLRWCVLGCQEVNRPTADFTPPEPDPGQYQYGQPGVLCAQILDLLTRLLSPNPTVCVSPAPPCQPLGAHRGPLPLQLRAGVGQHQGVAGARQGTGDADLHGEQHPGGDLQAAGAGAGLEHKRTRGARVERPTAPHARGP